MLDRDSLARRGLPLALVLALAGCTVGPDYVRPDTPAPAAFVEANADHFAPAPPASALWASFDDPVLVALIDRALAGNRTLAQAVARLDEARALRGLESFALFPVVTASASGDRSKPSGRDPFIPPDIGRTDTYRAGFDASWEIDLFGRARNARKAVRADEEAAAAALEAARQSVVAEVAQAYFNLRAEQERLRVQRRNVENLAENLALLELRRDAGRGTELDVARSNALGLSIASRLPGTEAAVARQEQRLAVLTALPVDALREVLGPPAPLPAMPALVEIGTPEDWLRRRPDIRQAERELAAATARVGIAVSEFFPRLTLLGAGGWTAQSFGDLGESFAERWNFGPSLSWSFLDVGSVRQRVRGAEARAAGALARYDEVVLLALEETENALAGYRAANRTAGALEQAVQRGRDATALARLRFDAGAADTLVVLDAERTQLDLEDQYATAVAQRATALAALYKALAGDFARAPDADPAAEAAPAAR
ncbi:MAG: efflux transporter outer membrane subunit [Xanthomonadaceae bacterium]|jgi:multidrug efflux system outer membrane protein|nr:efflux transporter outer membrane subunit [Xanthomonadaceae bacterium]